MANGSEREELEYLRRRVAELEAEVDRRQGVDVPAALFDHMFEGIQIIGHQFQYHYLNKAAAEHGRMSREELIGKRMVDVYPGIEQTGMFQKLRDCMTASQQVQARGSNYTTAGRCLMGLEPDSTMFL